jgi:hypothetical protein
MVPERCKLIEYIIHERFENIDMINYFKGLFSKSREPNEIEIHLPKNENATFDTKAVKMNIGK